MNSIKLNNISKKYNGKEVISDIFLEFEQGKIYGLFGRNGSGKSTLVNIITNKSFPTTGNVIIDGEQAQEKPSALSKVFAMNASNNYPQDKKIKTIFKYTKQFYPSFDIDTAIKQAALFGLNINKKVRSLSTGYNSIFKSIIALNVNLPYVIFDEPILGLDATHRELFYKLLLQSYEKNNNTIILITHLIEEVSNIIENIIIIHDKGVIIDSTVENILENSYSVSGNKENVDEFIKDKKVISYENLGKLKTAYIMEKVDYINIPHNLSVNSISLNKLFTTLTGEDGNYEYTVTY